MIIKQLQFYNFQKNTVFKHFKQTKATKKTKILHACHKPCIRNTQTKDRSKVKSDSFFHAMVISSDWNDEKMKVLPAWHEPFVYMNLKKPIKTL